MFLFDIEERVKTLMGDEDDREMEFEYLAIIISQIDDDYEELVEISLKPKEALCN